MIDGLKLTLTGIQLIEKLNERIELHSQRAADYAKQLKTPAAADEYPLPESVLESEIDNAHDQIETLTLIRDYIVPDEVYRLGEFDLRFADLLPEPDFSQCGCLERMSTWRGLPRDEVVKSEGPDFPN